MPSLGGSDFTSRRGVKNVAFFVCPLRFLTSEFVRIFQHEGVSTETILMPLDREGL